MLYYDLNFIDTRLAVGPGWELPFHQDLIPSHPGPGLAWDRELSSHQDLVPSRSRSHAKPGPGAPIPQRFDPIPVPRRDGTVPGRDIPVLAVSLIQILSKHFKALHRKRISLHYQYSNFYSLNFCSLEKLV